MPSIIFGANDQIDKRIFPFPLWGYIALFGKNSGVNYFNCQEERFDPHPAPNETEGTGAERVGKNDIVPVAGVGVNGKNGGIFSSGGVFFLLPARRLFGGTSPLMGDPSNEYKEQS